MKKLVALALVALLCSGVARAGEIDLPHITVYGTAKTMVTPDILCWSVSVKDKGMDLREVARSHTETVERVLKFLDEMGVPESEIKTSRMRFGKNYEYKSGNRVREGFFAATEIHFKIGDFQKYQPLWIGLAGFEEVSVESVYYDRSDKIEYQNETRRDALLAARVKAEDLAKTLGSALGEPLLIEEDLSMHDRYRGSMYSNTLMVAEDNVETGVGMSPGKITVEMRVKLAFRLITPQG